VARDATFDPDRLDPEKFRDRLLQLSDLLDFTTPPFKLTASRAMYRYQNYPHYTGGDRLRAESYRCAPSVPLVKAMLRLRLHSLQLHPPHPPPPPPQPPPPSPPLFIVFEAA
jgi:hypothetical protein